MDFTYIKLYRILIKKPIWLRSTPEHKAILITLLLLANHKEAEWEWMGEKFKVYPGQFVTSLESIRKKTGKGITIQNVRSCLKRFEKLQFATSKATKAGRLITIINWDSYQPKKEKATKIVTNEQQRGNKEATPNKNDKNGRMEEEKKKDIKKKDPLVDYLYLKIQENNFIETKDKIFEFYKYRQSMPKAKQYKTEAGINILFKDLNGCRDRGLIVSECIEETIGRNWLTPKPDYFKNGSVKNGYNRMDQNKQACNDFINSFEE